jgi:hypothetical protein
MYRSFSSSDFNVWIVDLILDKSELALYEYQKAEETEFIWFAKFEIFLDTFSWL